MIELLSALISLAVAMYGLYWMFGRPTLGGRTRRPRGKHGSWLNWVVFLYVLRKLKRRDDSENAVYRPPTVRLRRPKRSQNR